MAKIRMLRALVSLLMVTMLFVPSVKGEEGTLPPNWLEEAMKKYKQAQPLEQKKNKTALYSFFSLGMPKGSIDRMILDSEKSGSVLVLRGFVDKSLKKTRDEVAKLVGDHHVEININPTLFKHFKIVSVPAVVIAKGECETCDTEPGEGSFIKLSGDVTLDYALDKLEAYYPDWKKEIRPFKERVNGEN
jgi:conjugal transfer pilus assembly protein TrbC